MDTICYYSLTSITNYRKIQYHILVNCPERRSLDMERQTRMGTTLRFSRSWSSGLSAASREHERRTVREIFSNWFYQKCHQDDNDEHYNTDWTHCIVSLSFVEPKFSEHHQPKYIPTSLYNPQWYVHDIIMMTSLWPHNDLTTLLSVTHIYNLYAALRSEWFDFAKNRPLTVKILTNSMKLNG